MDRSVDTVWERLTADFERARGPIGTAERARWISVATTPGFLCVAARRAQEAVVGLPLIGRPLRRLIWWCASMAFGSEIALSAEIGGGFYMPHPYGVVVGRCRIGRNVTLMQNVTLGRRRPDLDDYPTIEDEVVLCAGAVVLGGVRIGARAVVGANAVVLKDVPEGGVAVGNPARIVGKGG